MYVQYCAKVMRANFHESRPLFSRILQEISRTFRKNIRTACQKIRTKIMLVNRKFAIQNESSKKGTFKPAKCRRINAKRKGKIIELSRLKNKHHHIINPAGVRNIIHFSDH